MNNLLLKIYTFFFGGGRESEDKEQKGSFSVWSCNFPWNFTKKNKNLNFIRLWHDSSHFLQIVL